ncbi:amidohydrolase/deacetylase family metallohydrolase [Paenibacillus macerans]|uniref:amidohydrolase/deacetylase family metallohydrolase n=1 Tax=Paenibacillus macerans TaxID=44252 RepID=UPI00203E95FF|nr:amidohydrolase/deacetylase family metallohydrolase [Paenibacillus macerans]MCM3702256.1 amidohydrolase/deacetylase family metallohydrolase [Paenibacillus macerans]
MKERFVLRHLKRVTGEEIDIVIEAGKIAAITPAGQAHGDKGWSGRELADAQATLEVSSLPGRVNVTDDTGMASASPVYVSSGWIDMHVHAFPEFDPYGDEIDEIGVKRGVTTIVDAGSCGADRIGDLVASGKQADTNLLAFLNISRIGLKRIDELAELAWIDQDRVKQALADYSASIVGLKARISHSVVRENGVEPLRIARELSQKTGLPLMVHIGSAPPDIREVIPLLQRKDIITHYLNGKANNLFDAESEPLQVLRDAISRGVHLDVGHGTASFSFRVAEAAKRHCIGPDTISTDIYRGNRLNGPVYSMANVLSKFLYLGYSLEEVIAAVTTRAAQWLGREELGRIRVGDPANLTLFTVEEAAATLVDSEGEQRVSDRRIEAKGVIVDGKFIKCQVRA